MMLILETCFVLFTTSLSTLTSERRLIIERPTCTFTSNTRTYSEKLARAFDNIKLSYRFTSQSNLISPGVRSIQSKVSGRLYTSVVAGRPLSQFFKNDRQSRSYCRDRSPVYPVVVRAEEVLLLQRSRYSAQQANVSVRKYLPGKKHGRLLLVGL